MQSSSLTQLIEEKLLPAAIRAGISIFDFWDMTIKEVKLVVELFVENRQNEQKAEKAHLYNQSYLNALFIGKMLEGKPIPPIEEVFSGVTGEPQDENQKMTMQEKEAIILKERMIDFANEANKRRNK